MSLATLRGGLHLSAMLCGGFRGNFYALLGCYNAVNDKKIAPLLFFDYTA
jgi:hypothetical protein